MINEEFIERKVLIDENMNLLFECYMGNSDEGLGKNFYYRHPLYYNNDNLIDIGFFHSSISNSCIIFKISELDSAINIAVSRFDNYGSSGEFSLLMMQNNNASSNIRIINYLFNKIEKYSSNNNIATINISSKKKCDLHDYLILRGYLLNGWGNNYFLEIDNSNK